MPWCIRRNVAFQHLHLPQCRRSMWLAHSERKPWCCPCQRKHPTKCSFFCNTYSPAEWRSSKVHQFRLAHGQAIWCRAGACCLASCAFSCKSDFGGARSQDILPPQMRSADLSIVFLFASKVRYTIANAFFFILCISGIYSLHTVCNCERAAAAA